MKKPVGIERLWASLRRFWPPAAAEKVWNFSKEKPTRYTNFIQQSFTVVLTDGTEVCKQFNSQDVWFGDDWVMDVKTVHAIVVTNFLRASGEFGVRINDVFYPHSRIDRIISGKLYSWAEIVDHEKQNAAA